MKPAARFLTAFAVASVATLALSVALGHGWRPATDRPVVDPAAELPLPPARPREVSQHAVTVSSAPAEHDPVAAWIVRPTHSGPDLRAGAVLIAGAGAGGRDDLLSEARALAAANVVTVVYDKRTRGYHAWERDFAALADDALRAADRLRAEPGVDPARVGLLGWSEGGWVVAEAARRAPARIAFAGLMSAPVVSPADQLSWMARRSAPGTPRWLEKATATLLGAGRNPLPWTAYDSGPGLAGLAVPVFGCWGADDPIVPVNEAVARVRDHVAGAVSLHVLPGAGHALPVESRYLERAARWLAAGAPTDPQTRGVEPASALGVGELPRPSWMTNPLLQLAVSAAVAAAVVMIRRRPRGRSTALPDDPEGAS